MSDLVFQTQQNNEIFDTIARFESDIKVCACRIIANEKNRTWTISSWYTVNGQGHNGYGTQTLFACLKEVCKLGWKPVQIEYIWNGANEYVLHWLNQHFGAISKCPMVVQKYQSEDDWESHIYVLNRDKFIAYFQLKKYLNTNRR